MHGKATPRRLQLQLAVGERAQLERLWQHRRIEAQVDRLRTAPSAELLEEFCALLSTHIRTEENDLFEQIQRDLPREVMDETGREIERRAIRVCL